MNDNKKSYYAIIPANVRYDKRLKPNAKLLYGEITALCNEKGYCWAGNAYFAELYEVKKETISRWISQLRDFGYVTLQIIYKKGTKEIVKRHISLNQEGIDEKVKDNNTVNNTYNKESDILSKKETNDIVDEIDKQTRKKTKKQIIPSSLEEVKDYIAEKKLNVDANKFWDFFEANEWHDSKGNKVMRWKGKILTWSNYSENNKTGLQEKKLDLKKQLKEKQRALQISLDAFMSDIDTIDDTSKKYIEQQQKEIDDIDKKLKVE